VLLSTEIDRCNAAVSAVSLTQNSHQTTIGGFFHRALNVLRSVAILFPTSLTVVEHNHPDRSHYREWLIDQKFGDKFADLRARGHTSSPFVWITKSEDPNDIDCFVGGHDDSLDWCRRFCQPKDEDESAGAEMVDDGHNSDHGYDYDLIVIGGGSGGMAAAKVRTVSSYW
jgi:hypothetical protein